MAELKAQKLELDTELANAKVGPWLQLVAHQWIHGTTNEKPAQRLVEEVKHFLPLPAITQPTSHLPALLDISVFPRWKQAICNTKWRCMRRYYKERPMLLHEQISSLCDPLNLNAIASHWSSIAEQAIKNE